MGNTLSTTITPPAVGQKNKLKNGSQGEEMKDSVADQADLRSGKEFQGLMSEQDKCKADEAAKEARKAFLEGNRFFRESNFNMAKIHFSWALKVLQNKLCNVEHHKATALSNIGLIEFAEGRYSEAKALLSEAHALRANWAPKSTGQYPAEDEYNSLIGLESLSVELSRDHQMMFSRPLNSGQKRLAATLKEHESVDIVIGDSFNNLAACMEMMGHLDEAKPLYEESLNLRKIVYGEKSMKVAESLQNLATVLDSQGHLKEAEAMLRKAFGIYVSFLGDDSPEVAVTVNNLAIILCHLGEMDKAQELLEQTVASRAIIYGEDHYFTKCAKQNLEYVINKSKSVETFQIEMKANAKTKKGKKELKEEKIKLEKIKEEKESEEKKKAEKVAEEERQKVEEEKIEAAGVVLNPAIEKKNIGKKKKAPKDINKAVQVEICC